MRLGRRQKVVAIIVVVYGILWILTATWGISDVDKAFDREFAYGYKTFDENKTPIPRIKEFPNFEDPEDPANREALRDSNGLFRCRTRGYAIAPFVVIDKAATVFANLGGFSGMRINLWLFGFTKWWIIKGYWAV